MYYKFKSDLTRLGPILTPYILEIDDNIRHVFESGIQIVEINLEEGEYNLFWKFRLDEALEKEELNWRDRLDKTEDELRVQLGVKPREHK